MISIFIMYSPDRKTYLEKQIEHMRNMDLYDECQKILVLDGELNVDLEDFEVVELKKNNEFNWSDAWNLGVEACKNEKILYLDSDRLLPLNYLKTIEPLIQDNRFVYTSNLFTLCLWPGKETVDRLLETNSADIENELKNLKQGMIIADRKFKKPLPRHGKNPMSGNTAFTKNTFKSSGGVDPWYKGHGAFADSDYFMQEYKNGAEFLDIENAIELHFGHTKKDKNNKILNNRELGILSLNNFIYFCKKWNFPQEEAINVANSWEINDAKKYVINKWNAI